MNDCSQLVFCYKWFVSSVVYISRSSLAILAYQRLVELCCWHACWVDYMLCCCYSVQSVVVYSRCVCRWLVLRRANACLVFASLRATNLSTFLAAAFVFCLQATLVLQSKELLCYLMFSCTKEHMSAEFECIVWIVCCKQFRRWIEHTHTVL